MQEIRSSNPPVITKVCDSSKSRDETIEEKHINKWIFIYLFIVVGDPMQDNEQGIITKFVTETAVKNSLKSNYFK